MAYQNFDELNNDVMEFYRKQDFVSAYNLLTEEGAAFPDSIEDVEYFRSCLAARNGEHDLAINLIEGAFARDNWYGEMMMRQTPSYVPLQGMERFEQLVEIGKARQAEWQGKAELLVAAPEADCAEAGRPTIIALHGNGQDARTACNAWKPLADDGWLVGAVQSSQSLTATMAFVWNDPDHAQRDVAEQFARLQGDHKVDLQRLIVGGFSLGGETALRAALAGTIPVQGFILLGPGGPGMSDPESWTELIKQGAKRGLRGYVVLGGEEAEDLVQSARTVSDMLNAGGIPTGIETAPGVAHAYPADFADYVKRGLEFIGKA